MRAVLLRVPSAHEVVTPDGEEADRETVPVNPLSGDKVTVEDAVLPTVKDTEDGLAPSPKSGVIEVVPKNPVIGDAAASPFGPP